MKNKKSLLLFISLLFVLTACMECETQESSQGVAQVDKNLTMPASEGTSEQIETGPTTAKTDEEITTEFTSCMRDHGINIADPELNADGTINIQKIRSDVSNNSNVQGRQEAIRNCVPLLENATFAGPMEEEDIIALQDRLLEFAQCLRDDGIDVRDPDFSGGTRSGIISMLSNVNAQNSKVQQSLTLCREIIFNNPPNNTSNPRSNARRN
jgi:hypothetical protein